LSKDCEKEVSCLANVEHNPDVGGALFFVRGSTMNKKNSIVNRLIELNIADYYARKFHQAIHMPVGSFGCWDGRTTFGDFTYELKFDAKARNTGNLAIETGYRGYPSGLTNTKADVWTHVVPIGTSTIHAYEFTTDTLRWAINNHKRVPGGDENWSTLALLRISDAEKLCRGTFIIEIDWDLKPYW